MPLARIRMRDQKARDLVRRELIAAPLADVHAHALLPFVLVVQRALVHLARLRLQLDRARQHARHAAQQHAASPLMLGEKIAAHEDGHAAGDFDAFVKRFALGGSGKLVNQLLRHEDAGYVLGHVFCHPG
jgi:hypothetical protein